MYYTEAKVEDHAEVEVEDHMEMEDHAEVEVEDHVEDHEFLMLKLHVNKIRKLDTIDQYVESDTLLDNDEISEIITKLPDESLYAPETAQAVATYVQVVDEPIATEEIFNDEEIIATIQAKENEKGSTEQEIEDEDELPEPPVTAAEVYNAMQTVIRYEEQENSESNITLEGLGFLRKLLKKYK
ncbi:14370_t:CDS:2, partial [Racocetra fulgida]